MSAVLHARLWIPARVQVCTAACTLTLSTRLHTCVSVCPCAVHAQPCVCPALAVAMSLLKCPLCAVKTQSTVPSSPCRSCPWPRTTPVRDLRIPEDEATTAPQGNSYCCLTIRVQRCFLIFKGTSHVPVCAYCILFQFWTSLGRDKLLSLCTLPASVLTGSLKIPLLQPQQTPLLQPLHTVQMIQSLHHHNGSFLDSSQHVCALPR